MTKPPRSTDDTNVTSTETAHVVRSEAPGPLSSPLLLPSNITSSTDVNDRIHNMNDESSSNIVITNTGETTKPASAPDNVNHRTFDASLTVLPQNLQSNDIRNNHNDDNSNSNDENNDNPNTVVAPFLHLRTNRAPPTMAFFNRWKNQFSRHNRQDDESQPEPQHPNRETNTTMMIAETTSENDQTTSLLRPQQPPQQLSTLDQCYLWFCSIRQILLDPETYEHAQRTIRKSGNYIAYCTVLVMLILVPTVLYRALSDRQLDIAAIHSARVMVSGTIIMSLRLVYLHLTHWYMPDVQKYVVRILWMVPIYAIQSYLSLRYHHARVYMSTIRDFYEAFVITSFVYYLMELLGGQESLIQILQNKDPRYGNHKFPISLVLQPWVVGEEFLLQCKHGVLQYVVFKTTSTILIFICEYRGVYGEGHFEWYYAYPYLCFFQNISVMYALYCLVIFFHACNEELHSPVNWHPLGKFLCIKGVVFFTWWQGVIIFYLRDHGIIGSMGPWSSLDVANGFIDYCIVVEMVGFAIAHSYTFTYTEYLPGRFPHSNSSNEPDGENEVSRALLSDDELCPQPQHERVHQHYRPPSTLPERMRFRDALWSSTVPHETLQDIERLRAGVLDSVIHQRLQSLGINRGISLSAFDTNATVGNTTVSEEDEMVGGGGGSTDPELEHPLPDPDVDVSFV